MTIESLDDYAGLARAGGLVSSVLREVEAHLRPGVTTRDLDAVGREVIARAGGHSAPADVYGFPGSILVSVNDEAVHGVPGHRVIKDGDLVKLDVTVEVDGYVADAAVTVPMPGASDVAEQLAACARLALERGVAAARAGASTRDVGRAVHRVVRRAGFCVLRELSGHGVGRTIHEEPTVPNWPAPWARATLHEGLVLTVEPVLAITTERCYTDIDGWTIRTADGSLAAHWEHTIVVRGEGAEVLTAA